MDEENTVHNQIDKYRQAIWDARLMLLAGIALAAVCIAVIVTEENKRLRVGKKPCNCIDGVTDYPMFPTPMAEEHIKQARAHYPDLDIPVEGGMINDGNASSSNDDKPNAEQ